MTLVNILNIIGIFLRDIMMIINFLVFGKYLLKGEIKKNSMHITILVIVLAIIAIIGELYIVPWDNGDYGFVTIFSTIMYIIAIFALSKDVSKLQFVFIAFCYTSIVDMTYTYFQDLIPKEHYVECVVYIVIYFIITAFILCSVKKAPTNIFPEVISTVPKWMFWSLLIFCFARYYNEVGDWQTFSRILTAVSSVGIVCCVIYFMYKIFSLTYNQNEILKQLHTQKEYSEKLITSDEDLRMFRHDYRNHMIVINSFLENGNTEQAREYMNTLNSNLGSALNKISTGNFITDAIINNKAIIAAESDIQINFDGQIPANVIADEDLCTIFANILDNAIEATKKSTAQKIIYIESAVRLGMFIIDVTNPVDKVVKIRKDGTIKTTKQNSAEHGLGMRNVQKAVKKYDGSINITCENKLFNIGIMMKPMI